MTPKRLEHLERLATNHPKYSKNTSPQRDRTVRRLRRQTAWRRLLERLASPPPLPSDTTVTPVTQSVPVTDVTDVTERRRGEGTSPNGVHDWPSDESELLSLAAVGAPVEDDE